jgi:hypothetical protein
VESKRFEDWTHVDCNDCARYWDSSCDGVQATQKPCNSFLASRKVQIPAQIKALEKRTKWLSISCLCANLGVLILSLVHILGWL